MSDRNLKQFKWWTIECTASIIIILAYYDQITSPEVTLVQQDQWIFFTSIASVVFSIIGLLACIFPQRRNVCRVESILVWLVAILWTVAVVVAIIGPISEKDNTLQVANSRFLSFEPNVYFFSLWSLTVSILMVASWFKEAIGGGHEWSATTRWILLIAMSFFTMLSALSFRKQTNFVQIADSTHFNVTKEEIVAMIGSLQETAGERLGSLTYFNLTVGNLTISNPIYAYVDGDSDDAAILEKLIVEGVLEKKSPCEVVQFSCARINYAIGLSAATAAVSLVMAPWKMASPKCQTDISMVLYILWLIAVMVLTTSPGPATRAGNLYFGIFICYFLIFSIMLTSATCRVEHQKENPNKFVEPKGSSDAITLGDIWQVAYGKLEKSSKRGKDRSDSYESMFETTEDWENLGEDRINIRIDREETDIGPFSPTKKLVRRSLTSISTMALFRNEESQSPSIFESETGQTFIYPADWKRRVGRLGLWCVIMTMGIILTHTLTKYDNVRKRLYVITSTSIVVSCIGIMTCLRRSKISNVLQISSIIIGFCDWVAAVTLFFQGSNSIVFGYFSIEDRVKMYFGEQSERLIDDPNIFFGMWISAIATILLITNRSHASLTTTNWLLFAAASLALLSSSMALYLDEGDSDVSEPENCDTQYSLSCRQQSFAKYLAVVSLCLSTPMILFSRFIGPEWHVAFSTPLVVAWGLGVYYVTFSSVEATPAATYFAFWGAIPLTLEIAAINSISLFRNRPRFGEEVDEIEDDNMIEFSADTESLHLETSSILKEKLPQVIDIRNAFTLDEGESKTSTRAKFDAELQDEPKNLGLGLGVNTWMKPESTVDSGSDKNEVVRDGIPELWFDSNMYEDTNSTESNDFIDCIEHDSSED